MREIVFSTQFNITNYSDYNQNALGIFIYDDLIGFILLN